MDVGSRKTRFFFTHGAYSVRVSRRALMLAIFLILVSATSPMAAATYRVGARVLSSGDDVARVVAMLGRPDRISRGRHAGGYHSRFDEKRRHRGKRDRRLIRSDAAQFWHYAATPARGKAVVIIIAHGKVIDIRPSRTL
ncbi:hypothetical protein [Dyella sp.]|uniref:hypothetical protein n=1 Tax=Dyella sp. TaxID=1869338 RepID=UPI002ED50ED8